jgi:hypothetical protein
MNNLNIHTLLMRVPLLFGLLFIFQFIFLGYSFAANGISSVNSFVEEKHSATDFRSRKQNSNGQRSDSGFDFIVSLERENISNAGTLTMDFDDDGNTNAWRRERDLNPRTSYPVAGFRNRCIQPLCHPS